MARVPDVSREGLPAAMQPIYDEIDAVRAWLGTEGPMSLSITIGYYSMLACAMDAVEVQPPAGAPLLPVD
jgi:hypothetical protein